ncbi:serine hydrolase domain-containing protein [Thermophagus xiamenensis]|uniref:CubicO group peptidase, beta-lactamase class C family n=1 Tax=Thermophagus xiamenensis TaxID=385682 RepID=A0A1I1WHW3_9BACT|nr:serine hydrolase domain-containing protein [Thermophagus xiamenensis]SFD94746.1 CubicO group peptidase, beta-lactamase class C family [Thermophagus xiamenensis]
MKKFRVVFIIFIGVLSGLLLKYLTGPSIQSFGTDFTPPTPVVSSLRISGFFSDDPAFSQIDRSVERFLQVNEMVGASVAIAKDGNLVFTKGYGWADKENRIRTEPYHLFRVASVSKLITAAGIMILVEEGKLNLDDYVFGPKGILNEYPFDSYRDKNVEKIKVIHLLNHSGGWTNRWGDPMFMPQVVAHALNKDTPVDVTDIIRFMLGKRLHFKPGTRSSYSNLGYAILGKIIEQVSGEDYESFIKTNLLYPLGIFDMQIGGSYLSERAELEVKYYEPSDSYLVRDFRNENIMVPRSYGGNDIKTLGAAGGWIASSTDLLKFMLAIDGMNIPQDILSRESIERMTTPMKPYLDPIGWRGINSNSWYRTGTLAGTSALMVRRNDGISYVILFNSSTWKGPMLASDIRRMMDYAIRKTSDWPQYNLFELASNWN